jgi:hypothetical protein
MVEMRIPTLPAPMAATTAVATSIANWARVSTDLPL